MKTETNLKDLYFQKKDELEHLTIARERLANDAKNRLFTEDEEKRWNDFKAKIDPLNKEVKQLADRLVLTVKNEADPGNREAIQMPTILRHHKDFDMRVARGNQKFSGGQNGMGFGEFIRAIANGAKTGEEHRILSTSSNGGGYTVPTSIWESVVDALRETSILSRAGASFVELSQGVTRVPGVETRPTGSWRAESASVASGAIVFRGFDFQPKTCAAIIRVSRELLDESVPEFINSAITRAAVDSLNYSLETAAFSGAGTTEPLGLDNLTSSGVHSFDLAASGDYLSASGAIASISYATQLIEEHGGLTPSLIGSPAGIRALRMLQATTNDGLKMPGFIEKMNILPTAAIGDAYDYTTTRFYLGDFSKLWIGLRVSPQIEVLKDLYAGSYEYGFLLHMRADLHYVNPENFCIIKSIKPNASFT